MIKKEKTSQMAQDYRNGSSLKEISHEYGITPQAVQQRLASVGVTHNDRPPAYQMIDREQLASVYAEDLSLPEIAAQIGTCLNNVKLALKFYQIPKRRRIKIQGHRIEVLKNLEVGGTYFEPLDTRRPHMRVYASAKRLGIKVATRRMNADNRLEITRVQ